MRRRAMWRRTPRRWRVVQNLVVHAVVPGFRHVRVDLREAAGAIRRVTFRFDDPQQAAGTAHQVSAWMSDGRRLTYVAGPAGGALVDDAEAFRRSFGGELPAFD